VSRERNIRNTVFGLLVVIGVLLAGFFYRMSLPRVMTPAEMKVNGLYLLDTPRSLGEFELVDHHGEPFGPDRLRGHWSLLFFGFTHCPDICPTTMALLNDFVAGLDPEEAGDTRVVMVSVDPARDTVEQLASYVPFFNPDFTGVTGDFPAIHRFATALNIPFRKVAGEGDNYQVEHGANVVLINPRGDYHGFFKAPLDKARMLATYRSARQQWKH
jgi:protein SCO1/2